MPRAIEFDELPLRNDTDDVRPSGHKVQKTKIGAEQGFPENTTAFFKPCDNDEYPPLLALYDVAYSQLYRLGLGSHRAALSLPVMKDGRIVGTISVGLNDFQDLGAVAAKKPSESPAQYTARVKRGNPDVQMLLDGGATHVLLASIIHEEDDLHPGNLGWVKLGKRGDVPENYGGITDEEGFVWVLARIDFDMSGATITHHFKARQFAGISGGHGNGLKMSANDLVSFPKRFAEPWFWPTEVPAKTKTLKGDKTFTSTPAFRELAGQSECKDQLHFALLLELLAFQPETVYTQLLDMFGDTPLGLKDYIEDSRGISSEEEQRDACEKRQTHIDQLTRIFGVETFYSNQTKSEELTFAEHFKRLACIKQEAFYSSTIFDYAQPAEGASGMERPFKLYLMQHPEAFGQAIEIFKERNKSLAKAQQYNIEEMELTYQRIWRDSFKGDVENALADMRGLLEFIRQSAKLVQTAKLRDKGEVLLPGASSSKPTQTFYPLIDNLYRGLSQLTNDYFELRRPTVEDNIAYTENIKSLLNTIGERLTVDKSLKTNPTILKKIMAAYPRWKSIKDSMNFVDNQAKKRTVASSFPASFRGSKTRYSYSSPGPSMFKSTKELTNLFEPTLLSEIQNIVCHWLSQQTLEAVTAIIYDASINYNHRPTKALVSQVATVVKMFGSWASQSVESICSDRTKEIEEIVKKCEEEEKTAHDQPWSLIVVDRLFSRKPSWEDQSFNTFLMTAIAKRAISETASETGSHSQHFPNLRAINRYILQKPKDLHSIAPVIGKGMNEALTTKIRESHTAHSSVAC